MLDIAIELDATQVMTLEAFADTIIPGEKRHPDDRAIAGAAVGGGAVTSGAVALMVSPEGGLDGMLDSLIAGLDDHAEAYAKDNGLDLDASVPPFVALSFAHRTDLTAKLTAPSCPEQEMWVALAMFSVMAWDTGAHEHTADAVAAGHPGLTSMGFAGPDDDRLWRFPRFSYGRALAEKHPDTTPLGDPA